MITKISNKIRLNTTSIKLALLDEFSGVTAAYSLRRLSEEYTGSTVRIRRDSDNSETDIGFTKSGDLDTATIETFARKNFLQYTEEFDDASWTKAGTTSVTLNAATAPDGTTTADRVNNFDDATGDRLSQGVVSGVNVSGNNYRGSVYIKGEGSNIGKDVVITIKRSSGTFAAGTITYTLTGDWVRVEPTTYTPESDNEGITFAFNSTTGNAANSFLVWGAQLELGSSATDYQMNTDNARSDLLVTTWYDQSGSGNNATQTTAANQPKIYDAITGQVTTNGKPAVYFDGTNSYLDTGYKPANTILSGFIVAQYDGTEMMVFGSFISGTNDRMYFGQANAGFGIGYGSDNWGNIQTGITSSAQSLHSGFFDGTTGTTFINGGNSGSNNPASIDPPVNEFYIGAASSGVGQTPAFDFQGTAQEIVIYNSDESSNRLKVEDNINIYYGVY